MELAQLTIEQIAQACGGRLVLQGRRGMQNAVPEKEQRVSCVALDSRQVTENGVFVATVGERVDGHRFIPEVFEKGACLAITEKLPEQVEREQGVSAKDWGSYLLVRDSFQALKEIAEFYRKTLTIPIVGITGSVGKTSTKEFIASVLSEKFCVLKTEGNYNNEVGVPLTLLRIRPEHQAAVVEMGISDFGEMHRLSKMVRPNVCVITNIGQCHLENLGSRDGILKAKSEIFDYMAEDGTVCLNGDDDKLRKVTEVKGKTPHFFGLEGSPLEEVSAGEMISRGLFGSDAVLHFNEKNTGTLRLDGEGDGSCKISEVQSGAQKGCCWSMSVHVPLPGRHMVINAAAAACVGRILGLTGEEIAAGISKVAAVSGRNRLISLPEYTLIDDCYNANPVSMEAAIDLLAMADTEKVAILGDMFELGAESDAMHAKVGAYAAACGIDRIYCVGERSRQMYEGAKKEASSHQRLRYFADREELQKALDREKKELLPEGGTILIKASHGMQFTDIVRTLSCS